MKRNILTILTFSLFSLVLHAQASNDSVKVLVKSSPGTEIEVDGARSSTNMLQLGVLSGRHIVKIYLGDEVVKTDEIDVSTSSNEFSYEYDAKAKVKAKPSNSKIYIDGVKYDPKKDSVISFGPHTISIEPNDPKLYFPIDDYVVLKPGQSLEQKYSLSKRRPLLYGIVALDYGFSGKSIGGMFAMGRRFGGYVRVSASIGLDGIPSQRDDNGYVFKEDGTLDWSKINGHGNDSYSDFHYERQYFSVHGGGTWRVIPSVFVYAGVGFSSVSNWRDFYSFSGISMDCGVMYKFHALILKAGYTRMFGSDKLGFHFGDINIGAGVTIHKNKKNKK